MGTCNGEGGGTSHYWIKNLIVQSSPLGMASSYSGNIIGYGKVTTSYVKTDGSEAFKNIDYFQQENTFSNASSVPVYNLMEEGAGWPLTNEVYKKEDDVDVIRNHSVTDYSIFFTNETYVSNNFDIAQKVTVQSGSPNGAPATGAPDVIDHFEIQFYDFIAIMVIIIIIVIIIIYCHFMISSRFTFQRQLKVINSNTRERAPQNELILSHFTSQKCYFYQ